MCSDRRFSTSKLTAFVMNSFASVFASFSSIQRSLASASAGVFFYGAWAYWANSMHGAIVALKAACVQGSYSFTLTLCMTMLIETMFRFNARIFNQQYVINWLTIGICCAIIFSTSWAINAVAGTPEIFRTVILGYVIGAIYSISYVYSLARVQD